MMQAIKDTVQCSRCGCIALPDATKCPKCGALYNGHRAKEIVDTISYLPAPTIIDDNKIKLVRVYYQLTCHRHGKIHVKATVVGSPVKCPFCQ
jgi:ribosomal protein L40E